MSELKPEEPDAGAVPPSPPSPWSRVKAAFGSVDWAATGRALRPTATRAAGHGLNSVIKAARAGQLVKKADAPGDASDDARPTP